MAGYVASLRLMQSRSDWLYLLGHGPPLPNPHPHLEALLDHRLRREVSVACMLRNRPMTARDFVDQLYSKKHPRLRCASERNVAAHVLKLAAEGLVIQDGKLRYSKEDHPLLHR